MGILPCLSLVLSLSPVPVQTPTEALKIQLPDRALRVQTIPIALNSVPVVSDHWLLYTANGFHIQDLRYGKTIDLTEGGTVLETEGSRALVLLAEAGVHDYTGDGDKNDTVPFLLDLATGTLTNSGVAVDSTTPLLTIGLLSGDWAFLNGKEQFPLDLNGDGDYTDKVVQAWDLASLGAPLNTGIAATPYDWVAHQSFLLFKTPTDGNDLHVYDGAAATHVDTGIPVNAFEAAGAHSALVVYENGSADLNGDGDFTDRVMHVFDASSGVLTNLGLAVEAPEKTAIGGVTLRPAALKVNESGVVFYVGEAKQGGLDLNGDGDALDHVLHYHRFAGGETTNLGLAGWGYSLGDEVFGFQVEEAWQGDDLNGDGDQLDKIMHIGRLADGSVWNTSEETCNDSSAVEPDFTFAGTMVSFRSGSCKVRAADAAFESWVNLGTRGEHRWQGDVLSLVSNHVLSLYLPGGNVVVNTGVVVDEIVQCEFGGARPFLVREVSDGHDLNGDGDTNDSVLRIVRAKP